MNDRICFNIRLTELMEENELTPTILANALGINSSAVSKLVLHNSDVTLSTLMTLKNYFNCSIEFLSGRIEIDTETMKFTEHNFINSLKINLKEKEITEYRIIKTLKFSNNLLPNWKKGGEPRLSSLSKISDYLECTIDYLVGRVR